MLKIFLWLRYLGKRRVVLLSIAAVALSCSLLIVVSSLFSGFINTFERSTAEAIGDVVLAPQRPNKIGDYEQLTSRLESLEVVEAASAMLSEQGLLHIGRGNGRAVEIWGIDVEKQGKVTAFEKSLLGEQGKSKRGAGGDIIDSYVSIGVLGEPDDETDEYDLDRIKKAIGSQVVLTTGSAPAGKDGQRFRRKTLRLSIEDVVFTGVYILDKRTVYVPIDRLCGAIYPGATQPIAGQIAIKLRSGADAESALAQIGGVWELFATEKLGWDSYKIRTTKIETSRQLQARYVAEIRKQMGILLLVFGVVSFSAVLLIFCIFYMIVETRRKDVAIMKSCGAGSGAVALIFIGFGGCIGIVGTGVGTVLGYFITKNVNVLEGWIRVVFGLKLWKASVYMFSRIPSEVNWQSVLWIAVSAIAGAAIGAAVPAISAAMTRPVNVLRYE